MNIDGLQSSSPKIFPDDRGEFSFRPMTPEWIQENISVSKAGVFRGIHLQKGINVQTKKVRVINGRALDMIIDLRAESPTFKKIDIVELNGAEKNELIIPKGCGHAFLALEDNTIFQYLVDMPYDPQNELTITIESVPDFKKAVDEALQSINAQLIISDKDQQGITLEEYLQ